MENKLIETNAFTSLNNWRLVKEGRDWRIFSSDRYIGIELTEDNHHVQLILSYEEILLSSFDILDYRVSDLALKLQAYIEDIPNGQISHKTG